jgi:hypothetical protein
MEIQFQAATLVIDLLHVGARFEGEEVRYANVEDILG